MNENEKKGNYLINPIIQSNLPPLPIIYVTKPSSYTNPYTEGDTRATEEIFFDKMPEFLNNSEVILIPSGIKRELERLPRKLINNIDSDRNKAIELCLLVISFLMITIIDVNKEWKIISSVKLHEIVKNEKDNTYKYNHILKALKYADLSNQPIINVKINNEGKETFQSGFESKKFQLHERFKTKSIERHLLKDKSILIKRRKYNLKELNNIIRNPIVHNLLNVYSKLTFPEAEHLLKIGKNLIKIKHTNKKGKQLKSLNKMRRDSFNNRDKISFLEDNLKLYDYLTCNSYLIPRVGCEKSGGRIIDSLVLMPSWIRMTCKIDNEEVVELDYKALHPNLAMKIYGGSTKFITHQKVAQSLGNEVEEIKIEHLSFFNKRVQDMKKSILYEYYQQKEPLALQCLVADKKLHNYKITSRRMFELEVKLMSEAIERLNKKGIYVIYVYDALLCKKSDKETVKKVMKDVAIKNNVFTNAA
jgi:hypothetical protein